MAKESVRLSVADLRRRLQTTSRNSSVPVGVDEEQLPEVPIKSSLPILRTPTIPALADPVSDDLKLREDYDSPILPDPVPQSPALKKRSNPSEFTRYSPPPQVPSNDNFQSMMSRYQGDSNQHYSDAGNHSNSEIDHLRAENDQLKNLLNEMRQLLQEASDNENETKTKLTESDKKLEEATAKIAELEATLAIKPKTKTELEEWADELERESFKITQERRAMDADRQQLRDDEEALEKQMREMEVGMARERALLARQETELKRLNAEIQHELESIQRGDATLHAKLEMFQRRHSQVMGGAAATATGMTHAGFTTSPVAAYATPIAEDRLVDASQSSKATPPPKKNDTTGLLRKLFRSSPE